MRKQPLLPPNRIAEFPPCPWRALFAVLLVLLVLAVAFVLSLLSGCATPPPAASGSSTFESRQVLRQTLRGLYRTIRTGEARN